MVFVDRKAKYPGRWTMKKSDGTSEIVTLVRNDEPEVEGTPMNAETLNTLSDVAGADVARIQAEAAREAAAGSATEAAGSASAAEKSKTAAATSEANAAKHEEAAKKAADEAGAKAGTDKTLSIENAPADAKAVGDIIFDRTKETPQPIFYSKAEVDKLLEDCKKAAKREALLAANPVGKMWGSDDPTSPASFIGGTWERIEDCTIWGASDTHPAGTTVEAGLPNIEGTFIAALRDGFPTESGRITGAFYENGSTTGEDGYNSITSGVGIPSGCAPFGFSASRSNSIYGASNTVQPPAYCMYIWRRVA